MTKLVSVGSRSQVSMDSDLQEALRRFEPSVSPSDSWERELFDTADSRQSVSPPTVIQKGMRTGPGGPVYEVKRASTRLPPELQDEIVGAAQVLCSNNHAGVAARSSVHSAVAQLGHMPTQQRHQAYMLAQRLQYNNAAHPLETLKQLLTVAPEDRPAFVQTIEKACGGPMTPYQKAFVVRQACILQAPHDATPSGHTAMVANGAAALARMEPCGDDPAATAENVAEFLQTVPSEHVPALMLAAACLQHNNSAPVCTSLAHLLRIEPDARVAFAMTVGGLAGNMQTGALKADLAECFAGIPWALPFVVRMVSDKLSHNYSDENHLTQVGLLIPGLTFARGLFECMDPPTGRMGHVYRDLLHACFVGNPMNVENFIQRFANARDGHAHRVRVENAPLVLEKLTREAL